MRRFLWILCLILSCQNQLPVEEKIVEIQKDKESYAIGEIDDYTPPKDEIQTSTDVTVIKLKDSDSESATNISVNKDKTTAPSSDEESSQTEVTKEQSQETIEDIPNDNSQQSKVEDTQSKTSLDISQENVEENTTELTQVYSPDMSCGTAPFFIEIIDDNFKDELKILIPDAFSQDDKLDVNHCSVTALERLDIKDKSIVNLSEVKYFLGLKVLKCDSNNLMDLDVSKNIELTELRCSSNQLRRLDLSRNVNLKTLYAFSNDIENLNLSNSTKLIKISIRRNKIIEFDLRGIYTLSSRGMTLNAYDGSKNRVQKIHVQESLKNHSELVEAKTRGENGVVIVTYDNLGNVICSDWNPVMIDCQGM